jgi:hypothetical protein
VSGITYVYALKFVKFLFILGCVCNIQVLTPSLRKTNMLHQLLLITSLYTEHW